jgi:uncharacterized membrane protein
MQFETSITVDAAPERVWAVLTDVERWPEWTASMQRVERRSPGEFEVGSRWRVKQPRIPAVTWQVTELEPGRSFSWRVATPGVTTIADHRLEPLGAAGVEVHLSIRRKGPLVVMVDALSASLTRRYLRLEVQGLKRRCEAR